MSAHDGEKKKKNSTWKYQDNYRYDRSSILHFKDPTIATASFIDATDAVALKKSKLWNFRKSENEFLNAQATDDNVLKYSIWGTLEAPLFDII